MNDPLEKYKDRSKAMEIFGGLTIFLGISGAVLELLFLRVSQFTPHHDPNLRWSLRAQLPLIMNNFLLAAAVIWMGIGSVQTRRWSRPLLIIFSWFAVSVGGTALIAGAVLFASIAHGESFHIFSRTIFVLGWVIAFYLFFFVILPAIWLSFYGSASVRATCEARDPLPRWTDACPLPVLGLSLWTGLLAIRMFAGTLNGQPLPFFGATLTGTPGVLWYWTLAVLWALGAWRLYRLDIRGWWLTLLISLVYTASYSITHFHFHVGTAEIHRSASFSVRNLEAWLQIAIETTRVTYLLVVWRYFVKSAH